MMSKHRGQERRKKPGEDEHLFCGKSESWGILIQEQMWSYVNVVSGS